MYSLTHVVRTYMTHFVSLILAAHTADVTLFGDPALYKYAQSLGVGGGRERGEIS